MRLRPTLRGVGMTVLGLSFAAGGVVLGSVDLVVIGVLPVLAVLAGTLLLALDALRVRGRAFVQRTVRPDPVTAGTTAEITVQMTGSRVRALQVRERAATELSGSGPLRARVTRQPDTVTLRYRIHPVERGRWAAGPLTVERLDPFGVARLHGPLGSAHRIAVWPRVTELPVPRTLRPAEPDRAVAGARSPGSDDAALREYQVGDDLRRVHWRSSARREGLLVRADEHAGIRPATVLLDQGAPGPALEWSIELAASAALALQAAGHPTRLVSGAETDQGAAPADHRWDRIDLLNATLDLTGHPDPESAEESLLRQIRRTEDGDGGTGAVFAVLGPLGPRARTALARLNVTRSCWAVVRGDEVTAGMTCHDLERAGWRAVHAPVGADPVATWLRLGVLG